MNFMSIKVAAHIFLFLPQQSTEPTKFQHKLRRIQEQISIKNNKSAKLPFVHNHLHDLESLWWVAVWVVFYNHLSDTQQSNQAPLSNLQEVEHQLAYTRTLFPSIMGSVGRRDAFQQLFLKVCNELPSNKHTVCSYLDLLQHSLIEHYSKVESMLPHFIDLTASKDDIYDNFRETFSCLQELDVILTFILDIHAELRQNLKRPRAESTNDPGVVAQRRR
jgi:tRNA (Thr-GGU) A37 N-methylase